MRRCLMLAGTFLSASPLLPNMAGGGAAAQRVGARHTLPPVVPRRERGDGVLPTCGGKPTPKARNN